MKKIFKIPFIQRALMLLMLSFFGCEQYLDVNDNPNSLTEAPIEAVLPNPINLMVDYQGTELNVNMQKYVGNIISAPDMWNFHEVETYGLTSGQFVGSFNGMFRRVLPDLQYIERLAQRDGLVNYEAIAKIMKVYTFQELVDLWGDVPYHDALKGSENLQPQYDDDEEVYDLLLEDINQAISLIDDTPGVVKPSNDDIVFGGNMVLWKKFANSLKLRLLIRQSELPDKQAMIQQEISAIVNEGTGFMGAGESATSNPGYLNDNNRSTPLWRYLGYDVTGKQKRMNILTRAHSFAVNHLKNTNDPRLTRIYRVAEDTTYGKFRGAGLREPNNDGTLGRIYLSGVGEGVVKSYDTDAILMLSFESLLLQAEAVVRGYMSGDAKALYESAIQESFKYLEVEDLDEAYQSYISQNVENVSWDASADKVEAIITQKWVAYNVLHGVELWNEFRRTGFPKGVPLSKQAIEAKHPVRLLLVNTEVDTNPAAPRQNLDEVFENRIFWDID